MNFNFMKFRKNMSLSVLIHFFFGKLYEEKSPLFNLREGYTWAVVTMVICTLITWLMLTFFDQASLILVYLLGVVVIAARYGKSPAILSSILSVLLFDFFFVPPRYSLEVTNPQDLITFVVMLVVALLISTIMEKIHQQAIIAGHRERRIKSIYAMNSELIAINSEDNVVRIAIKHISETFDAKVGVFLPDETGHVVLASVEENSRSIPNCDLGAVQRIFDQGQVAGPSKEMRTGELIYIPLKAPSRIAGVVVLLPHNPPRIVHSEKQQLLENFCSQIALALERIWIARDALAVQKKMETEQLRNSLLSAISHDLRTPLAAIVGASSILVKNGDKLGSIDRQELEETIYEESLRMSGVANNLLDIARLQSGKVVLNRQSKPLKEIIDDVLCGYTSQMVDHPVSLNLASDLPTIEVDGVLIERIFANLIGNAVKYTPQGTPIEISATSGSGELIVTVSDHGPGIPDGEEKRIFEKFYRASNAGNQEGDGLGLTISHAIVDAHGGRIWAENLLSGGAAFHFAIPLANATLSRTEATKSEIN